ncbi:VWA domain-containing protein [Clostridium paraputrificum]|uniref:VWA domain-containing protein n=1 Tax=Clostridium TaxID=1485 RepID=UPI003D337F04
MRKKLKGVTSILIRILLSVIILTNIPILVNGKAASPLILNKTATKVGDNEFRIDLTVNGNSNEEIQMKDIIIVMDVSSSMDSTNGNSIEVLKKAVNKFSEDMLLKNGTRISIIQFSGPTLYNAVGKEPDAQIITAGNKGFETNIGNIKNVVNQTVPTGSTNTQAALKKVNTQLTESRANNPTASKYVIFFTDGLPTVALNKKVVSEADETLVKQYIDISKREYQYMDKDDVKFISIGLFRNITDESLKWQEGAANDLLGNIQNQGKYMIKTDVEIQPIYDKIMEEIAHDSSIAKNVTLTDIVSSNFEIVENSNEPKNLIPIVDKENNKITWTIDKIDKEGIKVSFIIKSIDEYYASDYEETNIEGKIKYTDPNENKVKEERFPIPYVVLEPIKGSISIIKEIDNNNMVPPNNDLFTIGVKGGKNQEEYNFNVKGNSTTKVDFTLKDIDTTNLIYSNYVTIGEYKVAEVVPMNYKLKEVYINGIKSDSLKFTIDKKNPNITIKIINKYDNDQYFTDKADKSNELKYDPIIGGPQ